VTDSTPDQPRKHGVVAVLQDSQGRFLFIRRGLKLARAPGYWCFVGGEVEPGETYPAAIEREVLEEVGLRVEALDKIHETISPNGEFRLHCMRGKLTAPNQQLHPHAHEVAEFCWLAQRDALKLDPILLGLKLWLQNAVDESGERNIS